MQTEVLILTGSFLLDKKSTVKSLLLKQLTQMFHAEHLWLEIKIKLVFAEMMLIGKLEKKKWIAKKTKGLEDFFSFKINSETPDLSEVTLATLLKKENIKYRLRTYDDLFADNKIQEDLKQCSVVFVSSTYLKDFSELDPILNRVKLNNNRVVVGGALGGAMHFNFKGDPRIDVLAVGPGEYLVPSMANWILDKTKSLKKPEFGKIEKRNDTQVIFSGSDPDLSLDHLISPDWNLSEKDHQKKFRMIYYESVRGCPYRCSFCNYPYLFDDHKFRTKSANKMVRDFLSYQNMGVEYVTCLDSLFTMPKQRLIDFAKGLILEKVKIKWICYARTDDLCDEEVVKLLVESGCIQVQIGIESGNKTILENMNKKTSPEVNSLALRNCKKYGLTTLITLISGFPGETKESIEETLQFFEKNPADFFFICVFSTRVMNVPILSVENRKKFNIQVLDNNYSLSPYWKHQTMDCLEASSYARYLTKELVRRKLCIDATIFYDEILSFRPINREALLNLQADSLKKSKGIQLIFSAIFYFIDFFLKKDLKRVFNSH